MTACEKTDPLPRMPLAGYPVTGLAMVELKP
jgi:hypothetical protein